MGGTKIIFHEHNENKLYNTSEGDKCYVRYYQIKRNRKCQVWVTLLKKVARV